MPICAGILNPRAAGVEHKDGVAELVTKDGDYKAQFKPSKTIKRQQVTDPEQVASTVSSQNPGLTPYVVGRFQRLQQAESGKGPIPGYGKRKRHQQRATNAQKRRAIPKNTLFF